MGKRGGAGTEYKDKPAEQKKDGTVVKSYQRMPTQLLQEWAQGQKRPKPEYSWARPFERGKCRSKVILPDGKDTAKSLEFEPNRDAETPYASREEAAMVALLKLCANLPLERKLPDGYRETWLEAISGGAAEAKAKAKATPKGKAKSDPPKPSDDSGYPGDAEGGGRQWSAQPLGAMHNHTSKAERDKERREKQEARAQQQNRRQAIEDVKRLANMKARVLLARALSVNARPWLLSVMKLQEGQITGSKQLKGLKNSLPDKLWSESEKSAAPQLTPEIIDALRRKVLQASFFMADKDCDNQLSKAEFMLMVRRGDPYMQQKEIEKSFILATLGNGAVSFDAFAAWVSLRDYQEEAHALIDPLKVVWQLWNLDGDDSLSIPEFEHCIKQAFPKMKRLELLRIIRAIDEDFSGVVTQEEFGLFICPPEA
eukprot:s428_g2.t2